MARFSVTLGELTTEIRDSSPWLSRWRLRAWEKSAHAIIDRVTQDLGELVSTTELASDVDECECEDEDCECSTAPRPNIGFRSTLGG